MDYLRLMDFEPNSKNFLQICISSRYTRYDNLYPHKTYTELVYLQ